MLRFSTLGIFLTFMLHSEIGWTQAAEPSPPSTKARPEFRLKPDGTFLGIPFSPRGGNAVGSVPFDKPFNLLSSAQQARVKDSYESMSEDDEPPFPVGGLVALYGPIVEGQQGLLAEGLFRG